MTYPGQITLNHKFGRCLKQLAQEAEVIFEIGTFFGEGSTKCLHAGMNRASQRLISMDFNLDCLRHAKTLYDADHRVTILHGTLALPSEFEDFVYPDPAFIQYYGPEKTHNATAPYLLNSIPIQIDLLLIDGGCWTAVTELSRLESRSRIIALDDTNKTREHKNWKNREHLIATGWKMIEEDLEERNGYSVFSRP